METHILTILTRTPLHVGAGASVGAIDQPIIRERHTGLPVIPGSSIKGALADLWTERDDQGLARPRVTSKTDEASASIAAWLFGSDNAKDGSSAAGALLFSEARLLAFPIRSARGSFAWITSPLLLRRAMRDGVLGGEAAAAIAKLGILKDEEAHFLGDGSLSIETSAQQAQQPQQAQKDHKVQPHQVVLEEYTFTLVSAKEPAPQQFNADDLKAIAKQLEELAKGDPVWKDLAKRLVIVSDGQMSFFCQAACEVAQHVSIDDDTGTADDGGLFNQENVPADALFYAIIHATESRLKGSKYQGGGFAGKTAKDAIEELKEKVHTKVVQFGADASTGLGFRSVALRPSAVHSN